jgi:predicted PurR-regulated permease PerM
MIIKNLNVYFFMFLLAIGTIAGFLLIKPYLSAIFLAAIIAVMFNRPYEFIVSKIHSKSISSAIMLCVVVVTIFVPVIFISSLIYTEISQVITEATTEDSSTQRSVESVMSKIISMPLLNTALERSENYVHSPEIAGALKNIANYSISFVQSTYRGVMNSVISTFVMFFALFYFFIDGKKIVRKIMDLSPLRNTHEKKLIAEFISMARATLKGTVVIGFIQGSIGGIAFGIAGIASPVLWTVIMIVIAVIPVVGAGLVIFPAAIIMLLLGNIWQGVFLCIIGVIVSFVDNLLRPKLVGSDTQMHSLAVLFATIGGLKIFGFIGFIIGPIIMALMIALWKIYEEEFRDQLMKFNV